MAARKTVRGKRYFTPAEANAMLPLVRAIVKDVTELARDLQERQERLERLRPPERGRMDSAHEEELQQALAEFERDGERMLEYQDELHRLGIELKDHHTGLVDFPALMEGREVYLCWRLGEPEVAHWHEIDAGFAGRQRLGESPRLEKSASGKRHANG